MHYSFTRELLTSVWAVEPNFAAAMMPLYRGVLAGLVFDDTPREKDYYLSSLRIEGSNRLAAIVRIHDTMTAEDGECSLGTRSLGDMIRQCDADKRVAGIILDIDSGGGTASSVPFITDAVAACKKPVVAFVDGMACSAAYWAACSCNSIIVSRQEYRVGCIGTLIQLQGYPRSAQLPDGSLVMRIYADDATQKNEEFEKALEGDVRLIKERMLNPLNDTFLSFVRAHRPSVTEDQLHGRTYTASEGLGTLVDSIGGLETAVAAIKELSHITEMDNNQNQAQDAAAQVAASQPAAAQVVAQDAAPAVNGEALDQARRQLAEAQGEVTRLSTTNAQLVARVAELDRALAAANSHDAANDPAAAVKDNDGSSAVKNDEYDYEKSRQDCLDVLEKININ